MHQESDSETIVNEFNLSQMKNILKLFTFAFLFTSVSYAQPLVPGGDPFLGGGNAMTINYSVINVSQDNKNATVSGAHPGDVLRFEMEVMSEIDVIDYTPSIAVTNLLNAVTLTDPGRGSLAGSNMVFPTIANGLAPFSEKYVFFARVLERCGGAQTIQTQANGGPMLNIGLQNCDHTGGEGACNGPNGCGLTSTGPQTSVVALILGFFLVFCLGMLIGKKKA